MKSSILQPLLEARRSGVLVCGVCFLCFLWIMKEVVLVQMRASSVNMDR